MPYLITAATADAPGNVGEARGAVRVRPAGGRTPGGDELVAPADEADAVFVVGARHRSPRAVLPGPVVRAWDGRAVPVAWLPDCGPAAFAPLEEAS